MLPSRMTLVHRSVSATTKDANSAGVFALAVTLSCAIRSTAALAVIAALNAAFNRSTISFGAPAGRNTPFHSWVTKPGKVSDTGGTFGNEARRPWPVWATALSAPDETMGDD